MCVLVPSTDTVKVSYRWTYSLQLLYLAAGTHYRQASVKWPPNCSNGGMSVVTGCGGHSKDVCDALGVLSGDNDSECWNVIKSDGCGSDVLIPLHMPYKKLAAGMSPSKEVTFHSTSLDVGTRNCNGYFTESNNWNKKSSNLCVS
jgi:hypothetical protein